MSEHQESKLETQEMLEPTFRKAVELLASHHGLSIKEGSTEVKDMAGKLEKVDLVIHHPSDNYEVGVRYNSGHPTMVGDTYNHGRYNNSRGMKALDDWLDNYYTAVVAGESLKESGHYTEVNTIFNKETQEIEIEGVRY